MKLGKRSIFAFSVVCVITVAVAAYGLFLFNHKTQEEGFGIYLAQTNQVIITEEDVVWYNESSHQMKLTEEGKNNLKALTIDLRDTPFTAKLDGKEIFNGSFWTPISSISCSGIVIEVWQDQDTIVKIENGYPSEQFFAGSDQRNNPELLTYFQKTGKLNR